MTTEITITGMDKLEKRLKELREQLEPFMIATMNESVLFLHSKVPPYPSPTQAPMEWVSLAQYWFVRYAIKEGLIEVPYRRTVSAGIAGSITTEVRSLGGDIVGVIGTNKEYAPWVISDEEVNGLGSQAAYHKGNWWTLQGVVRDNMDGVSDIFSKRLKEVVEGA